MLLVLPPSETKRSGGALPPLRIDGLSYPSLERVRAELVPAVVELAADHEAAMRALKLGPRSAAEVDHDRVLQSSPTMPALDRYTGVLYDALDAPSLDAEARAYAGRHVAVHSALFGLVAALDPIPAYRLSHDSRVPEHQLKHLWREPIAAELAAHRGLVVDLRSEGYVELGPAPPGSVFVRVVAVDGTGRKRALNHFNKRAKGEFTRALLAARPAPLDDLDALLAWARAAGFELGVGADGQPGHQGVHELELLAA
ncbi:peroxide stress protein YaaA [Agromyces mediolanus]|uniref:YaaA family protein n=1 Tax=Agromyces mediolanus TaxID=41986 RepID=UPI0020415467|nr:peroxide stress protein YaaA [Agromyces mediolanus]MCM3656655.1 peroxide stress protein YaaA [Agromyces mediolanus]